MGLVCDNITGLVVVHVLWNWSVGTLLDWLVVHYEIASGIL